MLSWRLTLCNRETWCVEAGSRWSVSDRHCQVVPGSEMSGYERLGQGTAGRAESQAHAVTLTRRKGSSSWKKLGKLEPSVIRREPAPFSVTQLHSVLPRLCIVQSYCR